jgi:DNA replication protein DnaC
MCESSGRVSHFGSGTCVSLSGPASFPLSRWLTRGAELLFQFLTEREERSSVATATNLPFSEWGKIVPDARLVAAIIDRLTFHAHIIETGSDSYRLRTTKAKRTR